jgi:broad specificity phosphatase PhoE
MSPTIYLVRHAESEHNVSKDFSQRDPPLTSAGLRQASAIGEGFPDASSIAVIYTSPLTRALQTTLNGFSHTLRGKSTDGAQLIIDPDLQERSDLPCDTGSGPGELSESFPDLNFEHLDDQWFLKEGLYAANDAAVAERAQRFREKLQKVAASLENDDRKRSIVVVTHGVFMKFLSGDQTIDLPKAGWQAFKIVSQPDLGHVLAPVE